MSLNNIPKIEETSVKDTFRAFRDVIAAGNVQEWLGQELQDLETNNPVLCEFITDRAHRFAVGAAMLGDPRAVAMSMTIEYMLLLQVLSSGIGNVAGLEEFKKYMGTLFPEGLEGLDKLGDKNKDETD